METAALYSDLIIKRKKLENVGKALKEKLLGLDDVIDEVISLLMPWYVFPTAQLRPTVINLWGLTGSGKTALVQAIVKLLEYDKLYTRIDMGEFESDSASWLREILTEDLAFFNEKPGLICLDEFQFAKTLDKQENELGKDKLRVIWDLLDSGKIEYIPGNGTYYLFRADNCLKRLERAIKENVLLSDGMVERNLPQFINIFQGFYFDYNDRNDANIKADYFLSEDFINGLFFLYEEDDYAREEIKKKVKSFTLTELAAFVRQGMHTRPATKTLDLSRCLIFILGNLDEAYAMSKSMNPDISADEFYEATSKITIADVKRALKKRFRPEQIARLGNNHVIYKSFNSSQFRMLIKNELERVGNFVTTRFGWKVSFDNSVIDVVYGEGVFPAQGTRPVFTTVKNLIDSKVTNLVVSVLEYKLSIAEIQWKFENNNFIFTLVDSAGVVVSVITDKAILKLENLRRSVDPEIQAHTAVHEAGHAILAALTLRIVPSVVVSRTASDVEGFCLVNFPKGPVTRETLKKDIIITLGGYVAEKMIFGENMTSSGVYGDIEEASRLANLAIRKYAMGKDPIFLAVEGSTNEDAFTMSKRYMSEAVHIIKDCELEAERLLARNKLLLLKMSEYLTSHSRMEEKMISDYVSRYGQEEWIVQEGFIRKDQYYRFNDALKKELKKIENDNAPDLRTLLETTLVTEAASTGE